LKNDRYNVGKDLKILRSREKMILKRKGIEFMNRNPASKKLLSLGFILRVTRKIEKNISRNTEIVFMIKIRLNGIGYLLKNRQNISLLILNT
jgi:hypothetical protein